MTNTEKNNFHTAIVTIGTEVTDGHILNTNAAWLGQQCKKSGIRVSLNIAVPDNSEDLQKALDAAAGADLILLTGGLGPTEDDRTRNFVANYFGRELVHSKEAEKLIRDYCAKLQHPWNDSNLVQARIPAEASILDNPAGTAPGFSLKAVIQTKAGEDKETVVMAMPGVPSEMKIMFERHVYPAMKAMGASSWIFRELLVAGPGESSIAPLLDQTQLPENCELSSLPHPGCITVRLSGPENQAKNLESIRDQLAQQLNEFSPGCIVSLQEGANLALALKELLCEFGETLSVCESCTGGLLGAALTEIPGSSEFFTGGLLTYSDMMKTALAKVPADILQNFGAVSEETAAAMAEGTRAVTGADWSVAITGIAGPEGGSVEKPVGTVCFAVSHRNGKRTATRIFSGNRDKIRSSSVVYSMSLLRREILQEKKI